MQSLLRSRITSIFFDHAFRWLRQVGTSLWQVWLESTGALFLAMGALAAPSAWKEWHRYQHGGALWRPLIVAAFIGMTVSFGVFSFVRARRIR